MGRLVTAALAADVRASVAQVRDPHLPASLVDLGMISAVRVADDEVEIDMCLPCTACPAMRMLEEEVTHAALEVRGVRRVRVRQAWERVWRREDVTTDAAAAVREIGVQL